MLAPRIDIRSRIEDDSVSSAPGIRPFRSLFVVLFARISAEI